MGADQRSTLVGTASSTLPHGPRTRRRWIAVLAVTLIALLSCAGTWAKPSRSAPRPTPWVSRGPDGPSLVTKPIAYFVNMIRCIHSQGSVLWFGTYGDGLFRLEGNSLQRFTHANSPLLEDRVNTLATRGDELWIGTCGGISVTNGHRWWHYTAREGGVVHDIYHAMRVDSHGNVWVGTTGKGISRFDGTHWRTFTMHDGLADNWVNDLLEVPSLGMVAATSAGLSACDGTRFHALRTSPIHVEGPFGALGWSGGRLWVGLRQEGLLGYWGEEWFQPPVAQLPSPKVTSLAPAPGGGIWIGTEGGLTLWRPGAGFSPEKALQGTDVRVLHVQEPGDVLWIGTSHGEIYRRHGNDLSVVVRRGVLVSAGSNPRLTERSPGP